MIHKVALTNFGPHESFVTDFDPGLNLIVGLNGSGKSHIVQAIGWAICGTKALERPQPDYIRDGADEMSALVEVDILNKRHTFTRGYKGRTATATLQADGQVVAETVGGVQEYLESLNFDYEALSVLVTQQNYLSEILTTTPARRKDIFDNLLRLEKIREAQSVARAETTVQEPLFTHTREQLVSDIEAARSALSDLDPKILECQNDVEDLESEISKLQDALAEQTKQNSFEQLDRYHEVQQQLDQLTREANSLAVAIDSCDVDGSLEELKARQQEHQRVADELQKKTDHYNEVHREIRTKIVEWQASDKAAQQFSDLEVECPECSAKFCVEHGRPSPEELVRLESLQAACDGRLEDLQRRRGANFVDSEDIRLAIENLLKKQEYEAKKVKVDQKRLDLKPEWEILQSAYQERLDQQVDDVDVDRLSEAERLARSKRHDLQQHQVKQANLQAESRNLEAELTRYDKEMERYNKAVAKSAVWKEAEKRLGTFREEVLQNALTWVSARASQILQSIGTISDVEPTSTLELDNKLNFHLLTSDGRIPISRFSGGQKAAFSICLRIALSDYFSDRLGLRGLLVLDAVFESMDNDNREATAAALSSAGPKQAVIFAYEDLASLEGKRIWI